MHNVATDDGSILGHRLADAPIPHDGRYDVDSFRRLLLPEALQLWTRSWCRFFKLLVEIMWRLTTVQSSATGYLTHQSGTMANLTLTVCSGCCYRKRCSCGYVVGVIFKIVGGNHGPPATVQSWYGCESHVLAFEVEDSIDDNPPPFIESSVREYKMESMNRKLPQSLTNACRVAHAPEG